MKSLFKKIKFYKKYLGVFLQSKLYSIMNHGFWKKPIAMPESQYVPSASNLLNPHFEVLTAAFVHQFNEAACSVASMATVLNAANTMLDRKTVSGPITQEDILNSVDAVNWSARVSPEGFQDRRGLPIDKLGMAVKKTFEEYEIPFASIVTVSLIGQASHFDALKNELFQRLVDFQNGRHFFLIIHFNQGVFLKGLHLPHISPIGRVDVENRMVCILDVDSDVQEPYWISFDTFWKGISWQYNGILRKHGYYGGGYIWIELKRQESLND